jgi:hypothetical protein
MRLFDLYHHHKLYKLTHSDFWRFEMSVWLHVVALSLVNVFIPILLLNLGYSIGEIMVYYFVYHLIDTPLNFVARKLVVWFGARKVVILGTISSILFFVTLSQVSAGWTFLVILALFAAIYDACYWVGHLFLFIEANDDDGDSGRETSFLYIVRRLGSLLGPAVGAMILIFAGKNSLLIASSVIFGLSILPLLGASHLPDKPQRPVLKFKSFFKDFKEKRNYLNTSLQAIHDSAELILWPLFIFTVFGTIESVAALPIIVSITAIVFSYFTGKLNKNTRNSLIVVGAGLISVVWVLRLLISNTFFLYLSVFLVGLFSLLTTIPLDSRLFERGKIIDPLSTATYRNALRMGVRVFFFGALALLVNTFNISFILAAASMALLIVVNYVFLQLSGSREKKKHLRYEKVSAHS